jgi:predicted NBD/HSP70 family sugar kinase
MPVRQASVRAHNLALVLRHVGNSRNPLSRAAVAAGTGLTRATVSALVDDLLAGRMLTELDPAPRGGAGRPATGLVLSPDGPAGLGLEINVDYVAAGIMDLTGAVRHRLVEAGDQRTGTPAEAIARLARLAADARLAAESDGLTLAGAVLAVPGLVTSDGVVRLAPNLHWQDVDAAALLRAHPALRDLPVEVDNEANLAALGELQLGTASTFVHISGEIGIGAGIVLDGKLYRGTRGFSGEIGHIPVHPDGPACRCGARGCLEQYAGQEAILTAARIPTTGHHPDQALATLARWAAAGDADALTALAGAGTALGTAIAAVVNLLDVDTVVLGGSYAPLYPWLRDGVQLEIARRVLTASWLPVTVRPSILGADAAILGAAGTVIRSVRDDPAHWLANRPT